MHLCRMLKEEHYHAAKNLLLVCYTLIAGLAGTAIEVRLSMIHLVMGIILQFTSFITFLVFLLINHEKIKAALDKLFSKKNPL